MIKVILLVAFLSGAALAAEFEINWLQHRRNPNTSENVYEVSQNQTSSSSPPDNDDTDRIFTIEERVLGVQKDNLPTQTEPASTTSTTIAATTTLPKLEKDVEITEKDVQTFRQNMRIFAANIYSQVLKVTNVNENILFSPISITHAMGMVNTGARGNSSRQIKRTLRYNSVTENNYIDSLFRNTTSSKFRDYQNSEVTKQMVARCFIHDRLTVQSKFLTAITKHYHSDTELVNFLSPQNATNRINQWVEGKTNQLIKELISPGVITVDTRLVLVNAIYFKAPWSSKFLEQSPHDFNTPSGKVTLPFMSSIIRCRYHDTTHSQYIAIPYEDKKTYFFIILPKFNHVMESFEDERFMGQYFKNIQDKILKHWESTRIELYMPKFSVEQKTDVETILKSMGVTDIFDQKLADLTGIAKDLYVSDFVHKAKLSVDENGTEAAAASGVVVSGRTLVKEVYVDRPFIFGVIESKGDILFMGKVVNPSGK